MNPTRTASRAALKAAIDKTPDGGELPFLPARATLKFYTNGPGWEALCLVVDWGRYDNNAIRASFQKLTDDIHRSLSPNTLLSVLRSCSLTPLPGVFYP